MLTRAIENLITNAIRHSGGRRILVGARQVADRVWIWVIDDGRRLVHGEESLIFAPFEQGSHVGISGGFGLGLASTRGLVSLGGLCGARLNWVRGAAFYICLPAPDSAMDQDVLCVA